MIRSPARLDQMTLCFRLNIDLFSVSGVYHYLLMLREGGDPSVPDDERALHLGVRDPLTNTNLFRLTSFVSEKYEMRLAGNKECYQLEIIINRKVAYIQLEWRLL